MKPKLVLTVLCSVSLIGVLGAMLLAPRQPAKAVLPPGAVTYQVRGEIRTVKPSEKIVRIAHEEIPNYMAAMVMPFAVKDARVLKGLAPGDRVQFELVVTEDDSWISRISREPGPAASPVAVAEPGGDDEAGRVQKGERLPDFSLVDQDGRPVKLSDFQGKVVVVTFIYTRCPLPNFCPLMSKNFADLQGRLARQLPGQFQLLSITMDPDFDKPEVLKEYASRYDADGKVWRFATGTPEQIKEVATALGLHYQWENGLISHDLRTALIGPDGRLVHIWKSNVWTPYEVERMAVQALGRGENVAAN